MTHGCLLTLWCLVDLGPSLAGLADDGGVNEGSKLLQGLLAFSGPFFL